MSILTYLKFFYSVRGTARFLVRILLLIQCIILNYILACPVCHQAASCIIDVISSTSHCQCAPGYRGDGVYSCEKIPPPCNIINNCSPHARCEYNITGATYECHCKRVRIIPSNTKTAVLQIRVRVDKLLYVFTHRDFLVTVPTACPHIRASKCPSCVIRMPNVYRRISGRPSIACVIQDSRATALLALVILKMVLCLVCCVLIGSNSL